jgi:hypothetical protein
VLLTEHVYEQECEGVCCSDQAACPQRYACQYVQSYSTAQHLQQRNNGREKADSQQLVKCQIVSPQSCDYSLQCVLQSVCTSYGQ